MARQTLTLKSKEVSAKKTGNLRVLKSKRRDIASAEKVLDTARVEALKGINVDLSKLMRLVLHGDGLGTNADLSKLMRLVQHGEGLAQIKDLQDAIDGIDKDISKQKRRGDKDVIERSIIVAQLEGGRQALVEAIERLVNRHYPLGPRLG
jgi:hypothetical protein